MAERATFAAVTIQVLPIRMKPEMIESIELGRKTATRRMLTASNCIVEPGRFEHLRLETGRAKRQGGEYFVRSRCWFEAGERTVSVRSSIQSMDLLWVRQGQAGGTRAKSRLTLEVWDVNVSRLRDFSDEDAVTEGIWPDPQSPLLWQPCRERGKAHISPRRAFEDLWISINGQTSWDANPWVWTYRFTLLRMNIDQLLEQRGIIQ